MNAPQSPHPDPKDLANLARERLGRKKTQRILDHCKQCPECAELLLEEVRSQPIGKQPLQLSKWNWISIALLLLSIVAVFVLLFWVLGRSAPGVAGLDRVVPSDLVETVYGETPSTVFDDAFAHGLVSPDGSRMLRVGSLGVRLLALPGGEELAEELLLDFDGVMAATFDGNGRIARFANLRRDTGWFVDNGERLRSTAIPLDAVPAWAPGNRDVAWTRPPGTRLVLGEPPDQRAHDLGDRILGLGWSPTGDAAFALIMSPEGVASLQRVRPLGGAVEVLRRGLDASPLPNGIGVAPDGRSVYLALAAVGAPDPEARHAPGADRDLDIYELDLDEDELYPLVRSPGDDFWPWVAGDSLYWTHNDIDASLALIPFAGAAGSAEAAAATILRPPAGFAERPRWHPSGARLAYTFGDRRLADWGLNLDVGVVTITGDGASGPEEPLIAGYHADHTPAWSPDGRWLAYRSRRATRPVPYYAGPGVADDIFLRRADDPAAPELRLTDFGWEVGDPSWSADGRRLLFDTWERIPRVSRPWVLGIDPDSGDLVDSAALPLAEEISGSVSGTYSPVNDEILLVERLTPETQALWLRSESGDAEKLVEFEASTSGGAVWTHDGAGIVYSALDGETMQLFAIPRSGGEPIRLTAEPAHLLHPAVSPDGRWIAATRLQQSKEIRRLRLR